VIFYKSVEPFFGGMALKVRRKQGTVALTMFTITKQQTEMNIKFDKFMKSFIPIPSILQNSGKSCNPSKLIFLFYIMPIVVMYI
jgi:hypothetical protein